MRYSLRTLLIVVAIVALAAVCWREYQIRSPLEGAWRGTGRHQAIQMVFHRDSLLVANRVGSQKSRFQVDNDTIEIHRDGGIQVGRFAVKGNRLELRLANVGNAPPASLLAERETIAYIFEREQ